jgi:hypothetical protein
MDGTLNITYNSTVDMPLFGPGQGSTYGPLFWLICYWLIIEYLDPTISDKQFLSTCKEVILDQDNYVISKLSLLLNIGSGCFYYKRCYNLSEVFLVSYWPGYGGEEFHSKLLSNNLPDC